jgi:NifB/MoaA-like Fe-S oxidoreductase
MNRSQRKKLVKDIEDSVNNAGTLSILARFVQKQPWTFAEVICFPERNDLSVQVAGYGFCKVQWPDEWSPSRS